MSIFRKKSVASTIVDVVECINKPVVKKKKEVIPEQVKIIFSDAKTEGKKRGYERAAQEYKRVLEEVEWNYKEISKIIKKHGEFYDWKSAKLLGIATDLKEEKEKVEKKVESKTKEVSRKYDIPIVGVSSAIGMGMNPCMELNPYLQVSAALGMVYEYKKRQMDKAEQEGYQEAKELYEQKIKYMKRKLKRLEREADEEIKAMMHLISDTIDALVEGKIKVNDLNTLL